VRKDVFRKSDRAQKGRDRQKKDFILPEGDDGEDF
jgi:hypothetical protein